MLGCGGLQSWWCFAVASPPSPAPQIVQSSLGRAMRSITAFSNGRAARYEAKNARKSAKGPKLKRFLVVTPKDGESLCFGKPGLTYLAHRGIEA